MPVSTLSQVSKDMSFSLDTPDDLREFVRLNNQICARHVESTSSVVSLGFSKIEKCFYLYNATNHNIYYFNSDFVHTAFAWEEWDGTRDTIMHGWTLMKGSGKAPKEIPSPLGGPPKIAHPDNKYVACYNEHKAREWVMDSLAGKVLTDVYLSEEGTGYWLSFADPEDMNNYQISIELNWTYWKMFLYSDDVGNLSNFDGNGDVTWVAGCIDLVNQQRRGEMVESIWFNTATDFIIETGTSTLLEVYTDEIKYDPTVETCLYTIHNHITGEYLNCWDYAGLILYERKK